MFTQAIVRTPGNNFPDYQKALQQHQQYSQALGNCGVEVTTLAPLLDSLDSCFVENAAVITEKSAILTLAGALSHQGELSRIEPTIKLFYKEKIKYLREPGTLDGGDVLRIRNHFYLGLSARSNFDGVNQLSAMLEDYGYSSSFIELKHLLYLKAGVSYLGDNHILLSGELIHHPQFQGFKQIIVDEDEAYAANCIVVNGTVLMPSGYHKTLKKVTAEGYHVSTLDLSEYKKLDGGLSSLSLRF